MPGAQAAMADAHADSGARGPSRVSVEGAQKALGLLQLDLGDLPCDHAMDHIAFGVEQFQLGNAHIERRHAIGFAFFLQSGDALRPYFPTLLGHGDLA